MQAVAKSPSSSSSSLPPPSASDTARAIFAEGGACGFFNGWAPGTAQSGLEKAIYFYAYTILKAVYVSRVAPLSTGSTLLCGYFAEGAHLPFTLPLETVSKTMQTTTTALSGAAASAARGDALVKEDPPTAVATTGALGTCRRIVAEHGVGGLYGGAAAFVVLCMRPAIQFVCFERLKDAILRGRSPCATGAAVGGRGAPQQLSAVEAFACGAVARAVATVIIYPYIRAKVLAMTASKEKARAAVEPRVEPGAGTRNGLGGRNGDEETGGCTSGSRGVGGGGSGGGSGGGAGSITGRSSISSLLRVIVATDGVSGLYRGIGPELFRGMLSSAVMLMIKEQAEAATRTALTVLLRPAPTPPLSDSPLGPRQRSQRNS